MSSAIYILDEDLSPLICRHYTKQLDDRYVVELFKRTFIEALPTGGPILQRNAVSFVYMRCDEVYLMVPVFDDANAMLILSFLNKFAHLLRSYFQTYGIMDRHTGRINSELIQDNYIIIYELFDETLDYGIPQLTDFSMLKEYVKPMTPGKPALKGKKDAIKYNEMHKSTSSRELDDQINTQINSSVSRASTTNVSWRPKGIFYDKNEFFINFIEHVQFKYNFDAHRVMLSHIYGEIDCKSYLSGMPLLQLQLSESIANETAESVFNNVNYHQCVQLNDIRNNQLSFIPPDGSFKLLSYQIFHADVLRPVILVRPSYKVYFTSGQYVLQVKADIVTTFKRKFAMTDVNINMPLFVPQDKLVVDYDHPLRYQTKLGKVVHNLERDTITWKIAKLDGLSRGEMVSEFVLTTKDEIAKTHDNHVTYGKQTRNDFVYYDLVTEMDQLKGKVRDAVLNRAIDHASETRLSNQELLITVEFQLQALYSGLQVNYLQVQESTLQFQSLPWIKYATICRGDDYSFVLSSDQFHVQLTKEQLEDIEGNESPDETIEDDTVEAVEPVEPEPVEFPEASEPPSKPPFHQYQGRQIDFEEYKLEGEDQP